MTALASPSQGQLRISHLILCPQLNDDSMILEVFPTLRILRFLDTQLPANLCFQPILYTLWSELQIPHRRILCAHAFLRASVSLLRNQPQ